MNLAQLSKVVSDEAKAFEMIEKLRWPNGPTCPHCGATDRISRLEGVRTKPSKKNPEGEVRHAMEMLPLPQPVHRPRWIDL